jgi:hypothetical protein
MTQPPNGYPQIPQQKAEQPLFPTAPAEDVPWAQQRTAHEPLTGRSRRLLRDLPGWEPLPPGEILVQRHHRAD